MTQCITGILFDLGDTLVDFGQVDIPLFFEEGARQAYEYLDSLDQPMPVFDKYHRQQLRAVRWKYLASRLTGRDFNSLDLIDHLGESLGHDLTEEQLSELGWRWYEPVSKHATVEDGLRETLEALRDQGLKLGVVSNTFVAAAVLDRHLANINLLDLLPHRVYSCTLDFRKPDRRIFQIGLDGLGAAAEETIFIGDSFRADIRGANRMGMVSVLKDPSGKRRHLWLRPRHRVKRLAELLDIVRGYNG